MNMNRKLLIVAAAFGGLASASTGGVTVFVNDNPDYPSLYSWNDWGATGNRLSILHDAYNQLPPPNFLTYVTIYNDESTGSIPNGVWIRSSASTKIALGEVHEFSPLDWGPQFIPDARLYAPGEVVDGDDFDPLPTTNHTKPAVWYDTNWLVPNDVPFIVGVSVELDDGVHYGFIELVSIGMGRSNYKPLRWGYETEPNTPLVVPAAPCGDADLNNDGSLNFLDVSFFLSNNVDYNDDGGFNFLDVSAFLNGFTTGCP